MPKKLQKSLTGYLSKIKSSSNIQFVTPHALSLSYRKIQTSCKHPRTLSFAVDTNQDDQGHDNHKDDESATLSDIDRFLFENFRSLYISEDENNEKKKFENNDQAPSPGRFLFGSPRFDHMPPDLGGSHRFFVSPGMSGSLIEDARSARSSVTMTTNTFEDIGSSSTSTDTLNNETTKVSNDDGDDDDDDDVTLPDDCIAVLKYSPTPYDDFRRSMQEIVDEKLRYQEGVDWDFLEELLFCYLNLNEKKSYKFILSAFVDLIVVLRQNSTKASARSRSLRIARRRKVLRFVK